MGDLFISIVKNILTCFININHFDGSALRFIGHTLHLSIGKRTTATTTASCDIQTVGNMSFSQRFMRDSVDGRLRLASTWLPSC